MALGARVRLQGVKEGPIGQKPKENIAGTTSGLESGQVVDNELCENIEGSGLTHL